MLSILRRRQTWTWGLILTAISFAVLFNSTPFRSCVDKRTDYQNSEQLKERLADLIIVAVTHPPRIARCAGAFLGDNRDALSVIATIVIAIFTVTLWRSTHLLWTASERQIQESRRVAYSQSSDMRSAIRQAERSAEAATRQAEISNETAKIMMETAEHQLRAYVFLEKVELETLVSIQYFTTKISVKNFGQTPALKLRWVHVLAFRRHDDVRGFEITDTGKNVALGPGATFYKITTTSPPRVTDEQWSALHDGTGAIYAWGRIDYKDAFDVDRYTIYRMKADRVNMPDGVPRLNACEEGNEAT
jgi:hypothetical protein